HITGATTGLMMRIARWISTLFRGSGSIVPLNMRGVGGLIGRAGWLPRGAKRWLHQKFWVMRTIPSSRQHQVATSRCALYKSVVAVQVEKVNHDKGVTK